MSYPQCSGSGAGPLPGSGTTAPAAFGIVGVNNGRPGAANPCLGPQYSWAAGLAAQAPQLYVDTADPGNTVSDWPTGAIAGPVDPYGTCTTVKSRGHLVGADSNQCAFEYGVEQAGHDVAFARAGGATTSVWWLDVETANSWQSRGTIGMNQAVLLGMVDTFDQAAGTTVGGYSTHYQWTKIVGSYDATAGPTLSALAQWIPTRRQQPERGPGRLLRQRGAARLSPPAPGPTSSTRPRSTTTWPAERLLSHSPATPIRSCRGAWT